jgi:hypothetical protein
MTSKEHEIVMLRKQQQLAVDQEKNAKVIFKKLKRLEDQRKIFEEEKDPVKKEKLRIKIETKERVIEDLKKKDQLTSEQQR